jgi:hypothetical protein
MTMSCSPVSIWHATMKLASWLKFSMVSVEAYHSSPTADQMLAKISDLVKAGHQTSHRYASTLDRNMPIEIRQRLFDDGYAAAKKALTSMAPAPA